MDSALKTFGTWGFLELAGVRVPTGAGKSPKVLKVDVSIFQCLRSTYFHPDAENF